MIARKIAIFFLLPFAGLGQGTGVITVSTTIQATAGASTDSTQLLCSLVPTILNGNSNVAITCTNNAVPAKTLFAGSVTLQTTGAVTTQINQGSNAISIQLTKGVSPAPDTWAVVANGISKNGSF